MELKCLPQRTSERRKPRTHNRKDDQSLMSVTTIPVGSIVSIEKPRLQGLLDALKQAGYRVVGPQVADGAVVYDELHSIDQLPLGVIDEQDGGRYRLERDESAGYFDYVVGPHALKRYLFPPQVSIGGARLDDSGWHFSTSPGESTRYAGSDDGT